MTPEEKIASEYHLPYGPHVFESLEDISRYYKDGARYLDKLLGQKNLDPDTKKQLEIFLKLPHISKLVDEQVEDHDYDEPPENKNIPKYWFEKD